MNKLLPCLLLLLSFLILIPGQTRAQRLPAMVEWQTGMFGNNIGKTGLIPVDLDKDGKKEVIVSASYGRYGEEKIGDYFYVLQYNSINKDYSFKNISNVFFNNITALAVHDFDEQKGIEIFVGLKNGEVKVLDGLSLKEIRSFKVPSTKTGPFPGAISKLSWIEFGDIDNDGKENLITTDEEKTFIFDSQYKLISTLPYGALELKVDNIDSDLEKEIIYSDGEIYKNTKAGFSLEYTLPKEMQPYGDKIAVSDINSDGTKDVVFNNYRFLVAYDVKNNKQIWNTEWKSDFQREEIITTFTLFDYDGDQIEDIFLGNMFNDALYCYNGKTGQKDFNINNWQEDGITNIALVNLDEDAFPEIISTTGVNCSCADYISVYNLQDQLLKWRSTPMDGPFQGFDYGDVDNDGKMEFVVASYKGNSGYSQGYITVYDAGTYKIKWQSTYDPFSNENTTPLNGEEITLIKVKDIDLDGRNDLLIGSSHNFAYSDLDIYDDKYNPKATLRIYGMNQIFDLQITDIDNDGDAEIVIAAGTNFSGGTETDEWKNKIFVFDAKTQKLKWESAVFGGVGSKALSLKIGNVDNDEAKEILAVIETNSWSQDNKLIILDGKEKTIITDNKIKYKAIDLVDFNLDGQQEIVAATNTGQIVFMSGRTLNQDSVLTTSSKDISALKMYDINGDGKQEIIYTDYYKLNLYDIENRKVYWQSDTINTVVGNFNRLMVGNYDNDSLPELLLDGGHKFLMFELNKELENVVEVPLGIQPTIDENQIYVYQNRPNPFSTKTIISYFLPKLAKVELKVYDFTGKEIFIEIPNKKIKGDGSFELPGELFNSGIYFYKLIVDDKIIATKKMLVLK